MQGFVSFHPVDLALFDELIAPLVAGGKVDPEAYLQLAPRIRRNGWMARRFALALEDRAAAAKPPEPEATASRWTRLRAKMEKIDYRPEESARKAAAALDPDLHLDGRPFFIAEGSAEKVATAVDAYVAAFSEAEVELLARNQLNHVDPDLASEIVPVEIPEPQSDLGYRTELMGQLKKIYVLAQYAREGRDWVEPDVRPRPAVESINEELPWRALSIHSRVKPFWIARDVDGLETICRAAGVPPPDCLSPAWRVYAGACDTFPRLKEALGLELSGPKDVGAFVAPGDVAELLRFLTEQGARVISAAARQGEGPAAATLLRKVKECAVYAQRHGFGYLEASGIVPPERAE